MSVVQKAADLWRNSTLADRHRRRPMAYLLDFETMNRLQMEAPKDGPFDRPRLALFGWPVYEGRFAPPDGILFLPEPMIRSMAGSNNCRARDRALGLATGAEPW